MEDTQFTPDPTTDDGELFPDWAMTALSLMTRFPQFRPVDCARFGGWDGEVRNWVEFVDDVDNASARSPHCAEGCTEADFTGGDCTAEWMQWDQDRLDAIRRHREQHGWA